MGIKDLEKFLPVILINKNYIITSVNESGRMMLGDVVGKRCYEVLYNLEKPCREYNIQCPIVSQEENIDTVTLDFELYLRAYGKLPVGGIFWESVINVTNINQIRSGVLDAITGLYSKNFLSGVMEKFFFMWQRYKDIFSILYLDMDHLSTINENYGRLSGDEALKKTGQCIKLYLRKSDFGFRYESDEFVVLLPKTKMDLAIKVAKRISESVESTPFLTSLSVHIGIAEVGTEDKNPEPIIERAQKALLFAKDKNGINIGASRGRDRFFIPE